MRRVAAQLRRLERRARAADPRRRDYSSERVRRRIADIQMRRLGTVPELPRLTTVADLREHIAGLVR